MSLNRNGQTGFAFVIAPDHVRNDNYNIQFREKNLAIEAWSEVKTAKTIAKSCHSIRPQDVFNRSKLVPGEISYTKTEIYEVKFRQAEPYNYFWW